MEKYSELSLIALIFSCIWIFSAYKLFKLSNLSSSKVKCFHAIAAFPILVLLMACMIYIFVKFAPDLVGLANEIMGKDLPRRVKGLLIMPLILPIPLLGFYLWYKFIIFLNNR